MEEINLDQMIQPLQRNDFTEDMYIDLPSLTQQYDDNNYMDIYKPQSQLQEYITDDDDDFETTDDYDIPEYLETQLNTLNNGSTQQQQQLYPPDIIVNGTKQQQQQPQLYPPDIIVNGTKQQQQQQQQPQLYPPDIIVNGTNGTKQQQQYNLLLSLFQNQQREKYTAQPIEIQDVGNRDNLLQKIQDQIGLKRRFLANKQNDLKEYISTNEFLRGVKEDYSKYNDYIMNEKQKQMQAFETLKQYSEDLRMNGELTEERLRDAIRDQKYIMEEMGNLKQQLDEYTCPGK